MRPRRLPLLDDGDRAALYAAAAAQAAVIGGLAENADAARQMIGAGRLVLRPAQDVGIAVPLAQVLAPSVAVQAGEERPVVWHLNGFDIFIGAVGLGLIGLFLVQTVRTAGRLAAEEPPRS